MRALRHLALGSLLLALAHAASLPADPAAQVVLGHPAIPAPTRFNRDEYLFPSEINAREEHQGYQLWRVIFPDDEDDEEEGQGEEEDFLEARGARDTRSYISGITKLLDLDVWQSTPTHIDVLLPTDGIRQKFIDLLPPRYAPDSGGSGGSGGGIEIMIRDFPALFDAQAEQVADLAERYDDDLDSDTPTFADILRNARGKGGRNGRKHRKKHRKHRKPHPSPAPNPPPSPAPPPAPAPPPPPPPGSDRSTPDIYNTTTLATAFHDAYHPLSGLYEFMDQLEETYGSGRLTGAVQVFTLGTSAEGREIRGVKVHWAQQRDEAQHEDKGRKVRGKTRAAEADKVQEIYMQGGQHAREWVSPATILYFTHHLLVSAFIDNNTYALDLLDRYEFTLVPTINPDGYVYSQEHSRLWRKNRQDLNYGNCRGIDMNSNWGYQWAPSLTGNPCSESYPGSEAFEAVETKAVADYLTNTPNDVRAFIDVHSYGQLFMFPYSYSCSDFPKDAEILMEAGLGVAKALKSIHGTTYQAGQACDLVYRMAGDAIDWSYASAGIEWSYSAELRDTGTYGFLLPGSLIRPTAEEITAGLVYLARFITHPESPK